MQVRSNLCLCPVTVGEELLLVVEKLFACLRGELLVLRYRVAGTGESVSERTLGAYGIMRGAERENVTRTLNNGVHGTGFLAESAVNALRHVDVWRFTVGDENVRSQVRNH